MDLAEVRDYLGKAKTERLRDPARYPADFDWAIGVLEDALAYIEDLKHEVSARDHMLDAMGRKYGFHIE